MAGWDASETASRGEGKPEQKFNEKATVVAALYAPDEPKLTILPIRYAFSLFFLAFLQCSFPYIQLPPLYFLLFCHFLSTLLFVSPRLLPFTLFLFPLFSSFNFSPVLLSVPSAYFATPCSHLIFLSLDSFISFYFSHNFAYFLSVYFSSLIFLFLLFLFLYNACSPPRSLSFDSFSPLLIRFFFSLSFQLFPADRSLFRKSSFFLSYFLYVVCLVPSIVDFD